MATKSTIVRDRRLCALSTELSPSTHMRVCRGHDRAIGFDTGMPECALETAVIFRARLELKFSCVSKRAYRERESSH
jgi:hypothetical protein